MQAFFAGWVDGERGAVFVFVLPCFGLMSGGDGEGTRLKVYVGVLMALVLYDNGGVIQRYV